MKINQEVFDKTDLTEVDILKGVPEILLDYPEVPDYNNKIYLSLNNMCYEWDFTSSPYKFIK